MQGASTERVIILIVINLRSILTIISFVSLFPKGLIEQAEKFRRDKNFPILTSRLFGEEEELEHRKDLTLISKLSRRKSSLAAFKILVPHKSDSDDLDFGECENKSDSDSSDIFSACMYNIIR